MPVKSYIAYPIEGKKEELIDSIEKLPSCEVVPSENHEVIIIVTDALSKEDDEQIQANLKNIPSLMSLSMVAGFEVN
ncbi:hypothetical protein [Aureibacter tunicatorum]|uniref:Nitrate reductase NapAB chaperone NapD n=1 Tax=Aureibacter tunicatorum TaxID=866807 RepID=A0AAE4BQT3_9BACT|nr:hypothetical protein [Aureibacter tunicatorum]MDR6237070.1 nitrate reductase NapAB chaperone NapD [Aureibacter tunicatorum]